MELKHILVSLGISVLVVALGLSLFTSEPSIVERVIERIGASPGPDRFNSRECINEVCTNYVRSQMVLATTTPCALRGPLNASSTIIKVTGQTLVGTTTATIWDVATSTTAFATSTTARIAERKSVVSGDQAYVENWAFSGIGSTSVIGPGVYVVFGEAGVAVPAGRSEISGFCTGVFQEL